MSRIFIILVSLGLSIQTLAAPTPSKLRDYALTLLPKSLRQVEPGRSTQEQVTRLLGKPTSLRPDGTAFYHLESDDSDVTVGFKNGVASYYIYSFASDDEVELGLFKDWITPQIKDEWRKQAEKIPQRHTGANFLPARFPEEAIELLFRDGGEMNLQNLMVWKLGSEGP